LLALTLASGCVMVYAPEARRFSAYSHDQQALSMPITQEIQPSAQMVKELTGVSDGNHNTASVSTGGKIKVKPSL